MKKNHALDRIHCCVSSLITVGVENIVVYHPLYTVWGVFDLGRDWEAFDEGRVSCPRFHTLLWLLIHSMGWLRLVGSIKS